MAHLSARPCALNALRAWRAKREFSDSIIADVLASADLSQSDRGFAIELFYGVLRNLSLLDFWIGWLRPGRLGADVRDILRLGLYQLLLLSVPQHAAVFESVALGQARSRGFINAILRSAARRRDELMARASKEDLSIQTSHPQFLIDRWTKNFGTETDTLCRWNNEPPRVYARINRLKIRDDEFLEQNRDARPVAAMPGFVEFERHFPNTALEKGHCYIQDPSTALAPLLLDAQPGEHVLDACAAPGGKTALLAQEMKNRGYIAAVDRPSRIEMIRENLTRLNIEIATVIAADWRSKALPTAAQWKCGFDRILVDAPCSNTGVMRRRVDVRWRLNRAEFTRMQKQQLAIVRAVLPLLKLNGRLVYSTCSLEPEENEEVVEHLLAGPSGLRLEAQKKTLPFRDHFDGAFAALLVKTGS